MLYSISSVSQCTLNGASIYIDNSSNPRMMNASVNGVSLYSYSWTDTNGVVVGSANQIPFYTQWCVTITDNISGCDTTICQDCISDTNALCLCFFIYMPVCGCDGNMYSNSCIADCADVPWTPAVSSGMPGGFLPCSSWVPSSGSGTCSVSIIGDSIPCNYPVILEAVSNSSSNTYQWTNYSGSIISNGNLLTVNDPGMYYVSVTDTNGCTDSTSINMQNMFMTIYSIPNPPNICLGDSIYLVHDTSYVNTIWLNSPQSSNPTTFYPLEDVTYIAEAVDANGCQRRGEIFVDVDSCVSNIVDLSSTFNIYPNPTDNYLNLQNNANHYYSFYIYDIAGKLIKEKNNLRNLHTVNLSYLKSGLYFLNIHSANNNFFKKIIID